jgi:formylglycine-generating enzyme required for sulfatase activity
MLFTKLELGPPGQGRGSRAAFMARIEEEADQLSAKTGQTVRLPTEAEWEYVCRAETTTPFNTGETISTNQTNYDGNSTYGSGLKGEDRHGAVAVGSFAANGSGLYDMHEDVWECPALREYLLARRRCF